MQKLISFNVVEKPNEHRVVIQFSLSKVRFIHNIQKSLIL
jgi:hypothetical protein